MADETIVDLFAAARVIVSGKGTADEIRNTLNTEAKNIQSNSFLVPRLLVSGLPPVVDRQARSRAACEAVESLLEQLPTAMNEEKAQVAASLEQFKECIGKGSIIDVAKELVNHFGDETALLKSLLHKSALASVDCQHAALDPGAEEVKRQASEQGPASLMARLHALEPADRQQHGDADLEQGAQEGKRQAPEPGASPARRHVLEAVDPQPVSELCLLKCVDATALLIVEGIEQQVASLVAQAENATAKIWNSNRDGHRFQYRPSRVGARMGTWADRPTMYARFDAEDVPLNHAVRRRDKEAVLALLAFYFVPQDTHGGAGAAAGDAGTVARNVEVCFVPVTESVWGPAIEWGDLEVFDALLTARAGFRYDEYRDGHFVRAVDLTIGSNHLTAAGSHAGWPARVGSVPEYLIERVCCHHQEKPELLKLILRQPQTADRLLGACKTAAASGHPNLLKLLLDHSAMLDHSSVKGMEQPKLPLHIACRFGHISCARVLLEYGAERAPAVADQHTKKPLAQAVAEVDTLNRIITAWERGCKEYHAKNKSAADEQAVVSLMIQGIGKPWRHYQELFNPCNRLPKKQYLAAAKRISEIWLSLLGDVEQKRRSVPDMYGNTGVRRTYDGGYKRVWILPHPRKVTAACRGEVTRFLRQERERQLGLLWEVARHGNADLSSVTSDGVKSTWYSMHSDQLEKAKAGSPWFRDPRTQLAIDYKWKEVGAQAFAVLRLVLWVLLVVMMCFAADEYVSGEAGRQAVKHVAARFDYDNDSGFTSVSSIDDLVEWLHETAPLVLYDHGTPKAIVVPANATHAGQPLNQSAAAVTPHLALVAPPVLWQSRSQCSSNCGGTCPPGFIYCSNDELLDAHACDLHLMAFDGVLDSYDACEGVSRTLPTDPSVWTEQLEDLASWIDMNTRVAVLDAVVYSPALASYIIVRAGVEFGSTGAVIPSLAVQAVQRHSGSLLEVCRSEECSVPNVLWALGTIAVLALVLDLWWAWGATGVHPKLLIRPFILLGVGLWVGVIIIGISTEGVGARLATLDEVHAMAERRVVLQFCLCIVLFVAIAATLKFLRVHKSPATLVLIIQKMMYRLMTFMIILVVFLGAFAVVAWLLYWPYYDTDTTPQSSLLDSLALAISGVDMTKGTRLHQALAPAFGALFILVIILVLLNLLIAFISEAIEEVKADADAVWAELQLADVLRMYRFKTRCSPTN